MRKVFAVSFGLTVLSSIPAVAEPAAGQDFGQLKFGDFHAAIAFGVLRGEANEYVYNPDGSVLSRLIWQFDNDAVVQGSLAWSPVEWATIGVRGRTALSGESTLNDFDYPGDICGIEGPFCQSTSPNTVLRNADQIDVFVNARFYEFQGVTLSGVAGYRFDHFAFAARGGTSNYAPPFPDEIGITYDQRWQAPYFGLQADGQWNRFSLEARVTGSLWVDGRDSDNHVFREVQFQENFQQSDLIAASIKAGYVIADNLSLTLGYDYDRWFTAKGSTTITEYGTGLAPITFDGDAAGANAETHTITVGVKYAY